MWWLFLLGLVLLMVAAVCATHVPGGSAVTEGTPPGPPPYTDRTETDNSWLSELPALPSDAEAAQASKEA